MEGVETIMEKSLSACIKENDFEGFVTAVEAGAQVTCNHLVTATRLARREIFDYIVENYNAGSDNTKLLSGIFSQIGILQEYPSRDTLIQELLEYMSNLYYGGQKKLVFKKYEYGSFKWFLQVDNPERNAIVNTVNKMFLETQVKIADELPSFSDKKELLAKYNFTLHRKTPIRQIKEPVGNTADDILNHVVVTTQVQPMTRGELMRSMAHLSDYEGSAMYNIILEQWTQFLKDNVLLKSRDSYYHFAAKNGLSDLIEPCKRLQLSTTHEDTEVVLSWYKLLVKITEYRRSMTND